MLLDLSQINNGMYTNHHMAHLFLYTNYLLYGKSCNLLVFPLLFFSWFGLRLLFLNFTVTKITVFKLHSFFKVGTVSNQGFSLLDCCELNRLTFLPQDSCFSNGVFKYSSCRVIAAFRDFWSKGYSR